MSGETAANVALAGVGAVALLGLVFVVCVGIQRVADWLQRGRR
jgi:hypothetical protein